MSYVPRFKYDIYISYASLDDQPFGQEKGWISLLHQALKVRLAQLSGEKPRIWRDVNILANDTFNEVIIDALRGSCVMLCVLSPSYVHSEYCAKELQEFIQHNERVHSLELEGRTRIFKVLKSPVPFAEQPEYLTQFVGYEFYADDPETGRVREFRPAFGRDAEMNFWARLDDLAHNIATMFRRIQDSLSEPSEAPIDSPPQIHPFSVNLTGEDARSLRVFLCHSSNDKPGVRSLYNLLVTEGIDAWLDEEKLIPGQRWEMQISKAVRNSDAIVVCLSQSSINKKGYIQKEIRQALDIADEHPDDAIFLIPVRLEECRIPDRLSQWQWVNLFEERGTKLLLRALEARSSQLSVAAETGDLIKTMLK